MPCYFDRASAIRPNLPSYSDDVLDQKLDDVIFKLKMLKIEIRDAQTKEELHRLRKMQDYSLAVKRFIRIEIKKREDRLQQEAVNEAVEIVEIDDSEEQSPPSNEDRKPTREEYEEMEREDLRQIGLNMTFSHIHINNLSPVVVPDLDIEFMDRPALFDPEIQVNFVPSIYDYDNHDMHFLDVLFSVDDTDIEPSVSNVSQADISSSEALPLTITLKEPISNCGAYDDGQIDYRLALDVRTGEAFPANKFAEQLYIGSDGCYYGIDPYDNVRLLKVKQHRYVCFGNHRLDRKQDRIYLSCIV